MSRKRERASIDFDALVNTESAGEVAAHIFGDESRRGGYLRQTDEGFRFGRINLTAIGLPPDTDLSPEEFESLGEMLARLEGSLQWLLGDWLAYGETRWGETAAHIAEAVGLDVNTLYSYASVCRNVQFLIRIKNLSFSHHRLVAALPPDSQRHWLELADEHDWSVATMKSHIQQALNPPANSTTPAWQKPIERLSKFFTPIKLKRMNPADRHQLRDHLAHLIAQIDAIKD